MYNEQRRALASRTYNEDEPILDSSDVTPRIVCPYKRINNRALPWWFWWSQTHETTTRISQQQLEVSQSTAHGITLNVTLASPQEKLLVKQCSILTHSICHFQLPLSEQITDSLFSHSSLMSTFTPWKPRAALAWNVTQRWVFFSHILLSLWKISSFSTNYSQFLSTVMSLAQWRSRWPDPDVMRRRLVGPGVCRHSNTWPWDGGRSSHAERSVQRKQNKNDRWLSKFTKLLSFKTSHFH